MRFVPGVVTERGTSLPADRIQNFAPSVIREMTRLSFEYGAINMSQGFPDFPCPVEIKEAAAKAIYDDQNQYTITWGIKPLRDAVAAKAIRFNGIEANGDENVTVTCGASEGMVAALLSLVNPGDEVIVFEPFFETYVPDIYLCGATPVYVPLYPPTFHFDPDELRRAFSSNTKAIVINTPHNPTGHVLSREELQVIADLCQEFDVIALSDEIYEYLTYDGHQHISIATLPGMADRTITVSGLSKTYSITGWRLGYAVASAALTRNLRQVHDFIAVCAPAPLQQAALTALSLPDRYYDSLRAGYTRRREILMEGLTAAGFGVRPPEGTYFLMADIRPLGFDDDDKLARWMVREVGVAAVPGSSFYKTGELGRSLLRFAFCKQDQTLADVRERLASLRTAQIA